MTLKAPARNKPARGEVSETKSRCRRCGQAELRSPMSRTLRKHATKQRLIDAGLRMLLEQGYNSLGLQTLLTRPDS